MESRAVPGYIKVVWRGKLTRACRAIIEKQLRGVDGDDGNSKKKSLFAVWSRKWNKKNSTIITEYSLGLCLLDVAVKVFCKQTNKHTSSFLPVCHFSVWPLLVTKFLRRLFLFFALFFCLNGCKSFLFPTRCCYNMAMCICYLIGKIKKNIHRILKTQHLLCSREKKNKEFKQIKVNEANKCGERWISFFWRSHNPSEWIKKCFFKGFTSKKFCTFKV